MAYVEYSDLTGKIPLPFLIQALDDDNDGAVDPGVWELVQAQACQSVDSRLGQRYPVPLASDAPGIAVAREAALIFALEGVYARRVGPEQNPWMGMGNAQRAKLDRIGEGDESLTPQTKRAKPSGSVIAEASRTYSGRLAL